jgi:hypothetical protein
MGRFKIINVNWVEKPSRGPVDGLRDTEDPLNSSWVGNTGYTPLPTIPQLRARRTFW